MTAELPECLHAGTTTLRWLYGEAEDAHAAHVAACPSCTAAVDAHERALGALAAAGEVVATCGAGVAAAPGGDARGPSVAVGAAWRRVAPWAGLAAACAVAAAALFAVVARGTVVPPDTAPATGLATFAADDALLDLHDEIDALEATFASL